MRKQVVIGFFFLLLTVGKLNSQHGISFVYSPTKVVKHSKALLFDIPDRSHEFRLAYTIQTQGDNSWERYWNKPRITINALWVDFGNQDVLGNAFAILPELHFNLKQWGKLRLNLQFGTGIAYMDKPYHEITNPENNAIGSYLNNTSSLKLGAAYLWNEQWITTFSGGLVHFSNGLSSSPNKGINVFGLTMGVVYQFENSKKEEISTNSIQKLEEEQSTSYNRWVLDAQYQYGFTEHTVPGGPKYSVDVISIAGGFRYSEFMTVFFGGEYEYNDQVYVFYKRNFYTEDEAFDFARKTSLFVENEFRFGPVFSRLRLGYYLPWPISHSKSMYTKITTGIYLPKIGGTARPYIGVLLKTHSAVADYLGVLVGVSI